MDNENITNIETVDTETIEEVASSNGVVIAAGIGLVLLGCGLVYKLKIKPLVAKIKSRKEEPEIKEVNAEEIEEVIDVDEYEEQEN